MLRVSPTNAAVRARCLQAACQNTMASPENPNSNPYGLASYANRSAPDTQGRSIATKPNSALVDLDTKRNKQTLITRKPSVCGNRVAVAPSPKIAHEARVARSTKGGFRSAPSLRACQIIPRVGKWEL